jgi:hypothetical protein
VRAVAPNKKIVIEKGCQEARGVRHNSWMKGNLERYVKSTLYAQTLGAFKTISAHRSRQSGGHERMA